MKFRVLLISIFILLCNSLLLAKDTRIILPIIGDKVNLRSKPTLNSKVITRMDINLLVQLLKTKSKWQTIGGKRGRWVYIDTGSSNPNSNGTIKGWMFDYYLGYKYRFKRVYKWRRSYIENYVGDAYYRYDFYPNGIIKSLAYSTVYRHPSKGKPKPTYCYLYRCRRVYAARLKNGKFGIYFLKDKNGLLQTRYVKFDPKTRERIPDSEILVNRKKNKNFAKKRITGFYDYATNFCI